MTQAIIIQNGVTITNGVVIRSSTGAGDPILLTSIPSQIIGTEGVISTGTITGTTNNVFVFGISNTSGSNQTVSWGYVTL